MHERIRSFIEEKLKRQSFYLTVPSGSFFLIYGVYGSRTFAPCSTRSLAQFAWPCWHAPWRGDTWSSVLRFTHIPCERTRTHEFTINQWLHKLCLAKVFLKLEHGASSCGENFLKTENQILQRLQTSVSSLACFTYWQLHFTNVGRSFNL